MKKTIQTLFILLLVFFAAITVKTMAGTGNNLLGWPWGGGTESDGFLPGDGTNTNAGWISLNSLNCDTNDDGKSEGANGCPATGTAVANYGVNVPVVDGNVTGYAWSENLGWLDFAPVGLYPAVASGDDYAHSAKRIGNDLKGWIRVVSIKDALAVGNSGGWQGWIRLGSDANDPISYGVSINPDGTFTGKAWSEELGWLDFSQAFMIPAPPQITLFESSSNMIVLNSGEDLLVTPKSVTLSWAVSGVVNANACQASGGWSGNKAAAGGSEAVQLTSANTTFTLTCNGPGGTDTKGFFVATGCYDNTCNFMDAICGSTFKPTTKADDCIRTCFSNNDCIQPNANWMEVAPE